MKTNKDKLVKQAIAASIHHPTMNPGLYYVGFDGQGRYLPGTGSITYNFQIGDKCMELVGDHVEPGVSVRNPNDKENNAFIALACIGNEVTLISGDARGEKGVVVGKHGGVNHTMIYFPEEVLEKLNVNDMVRVKAYGCGLEFRDFDTKVLNIDPELLDRILNSIPQEPNKISVPVTHIIPSYMMGAGLGSTDASSDYDIMTQDRDEVNRLELMDLRFGDIIAIENQTTHHGPHYKKGAITIGVIVHSDSFSAGHGPGVTVIMSGSSEEINVVKNVNANLAYYLK